MFPNPLLACNAKQAAMCAATHALMHIRAHLSFGPRLPKPQVYLPINEHQLSVLWAPCRMGG
jgi:hypothetical protein